MVSKIPLPTDNIYKFYALFSLLLLIFALGSIIYITSVTNQVLMDSLVELETLKQEKTPTPTQILKKAIHERKIVIAKADKKGFEIVLGALITFAVFGLYYGFKKWHTEIQPVADATAQVQLEIAKLQLEKLRLDLSKDNAQPACQNEG